MKKLIFAFATLVATIVSATNLKADNDDALITIEDEKITLDEFLFLYNKNNNIESIENLSVDDYLERYINFKLKVREAKELQLDTVPSFIKELQGYEEELAKPYLYDSAKKEEIVKEAYYRMNTMVDASHILVQPKSNAPEDTLAAYQKIMEARQKIVDGADFAEVAKQYSNDPSAKNNGGRLGFFEGFQMVYDFENVAYNLEPKELSQPFKTRFGYHIIKVHDKKPHPGEVQVRHIYKAVRPNFTQAQKDSVIKEIEIAYDSLKAGMSFPEAAKKFSDHAQSAANGGMLGWFGPGRMIPEFEEQSFALDTGKYTKPFESSVGWHIVYLLEKRPVPEFDEVKETILDKIKRDNRIFQSQVKKVNDLKKEYDYSLDSEIHTAALDFINARKHTVDSVAKDFRYYNNTLFTLEDTTVSGGDFIEYAKNQRSANAQTPATDVFDTYETETIITYEKSKLKEKYPDYRFLMGEYKDGMLLFEISNQKVWEKASRDTTGLENFYAQHKDNYTWDKRFKGKIYLAKNKEVKKALSKFLKQNVDTLTNSQLIDTLNLNQDDILKLEGAFSEGDNKYVDYYIWKEKDIDAGKYAGYEVVKKGKIVKSEPKKLNENRGQVISDFQNYLEEKWITELRDKYNVEVNRELLKEYLNDKD